MAGTENAAPDFSIQAGLLQGNKVSGQTFPEPSGAMDGGGFFLHFITISSNHVEIISFIIFLRFDDV